MNKYEDYKNYRIPKGHGKYRKINEPSDYLKALQTEIAEILDKLIKDTKYAVGFVKKKGLVDGAQRHMNAKVLLNMDVKSFFDNIKPEILEVEIRKGFKEKKINDKLIKFLCGQSDEITEDTVVNNIDDFIALILKACFYRGSTPQGAPSSPKLSNIYMRDFDKTLSKRIAELGEADNVKFSYSRYADDVTIGCLTEHYDMWRPVAIINEELGKLGLRANKEKTKILRGNKRQEVTGLAIGRLSNPGHKLITWIDVVKNRTEYFIRLRHIARGHVAVSWSNHRREKLRAKLHQLYFRLEKNEEVSRSEQLSIAGELSMLYANDRANFYKYKKELDKLNQLGKNSKIKSIMSFREKMDCAKTILLSTNFCKGEIEIKNFEKYKSRVIAIDELAFTDTKEEQVLKAIKATETTLQLDGYAIRTRKTLRDYVVN